MSLAPIKHVPVGTQFTGITNNGVVIPLAQVVAVDVNFNLTHRVRWFDENGKHYEWYNLNNPVEHFREFEIIINPKVQ